MYAKQDETVECIKNCDKALEVDPKCVKALYRKALVILLNKISYEVLLSVYFCFDCPTHGYNFQDVLLFQALQEQNDADEAIIEYKKVLEYEPDNKVLHYIYSNTVISSVESSQLVHSYYHSLQVLGSSSANSGM